MRLAPRLRLRGLFEEGLKNSSWASRSLYRFAAFVVVVSFVEGDVVSALAAGAGSGLAFRLRGQGGGPFMMTLTSEPSRRALTRSLQ